ncbi:MAG: pseudouridine synthase [Lachnospiraceae bacterium]|nr:pseudouridine synthase [Lachnospiraceae bacterium]
MQELDGIRINKYLSSSGVCSRRNADILVSEGRVEVNGVKAAPGMKVGPDDIITVNGKQITVKNEKVVLAYYKSKGITVTEKDKFAQNKISDVIKYPERVTYAGRLDKESEGLLILTNDGDLINRLTSPKYFHEKEYQVKINKEVTPDFIKKMSSGIYLKELNITTRPCVVNKTGKFTFNIVLTQGVNRQIRRMCKELNCYVTSLKRVRIANILLANLKIGEFRKIEGIELQALYNVIHKDC